MPKAVYNKHKMKKKRERQKTEKAATAAHSSQSLHKAKKYEQKKRGQRRFAWGFLALAVFGSSSVLAIAALGNSIFQLKEVEIAKAPTAQLSSAGVKESTSVALPVTYYDQWSDLCVYDDGEKIEPERRQFEWTMCGYGERGIEQGLMTPGLGTAGYPVAVPGKNETNQGLDTDKWFDLVEGETEQESGTLQLRYNKDGATFTFGADDFYPMDGVEFSHEDAVNKDGHNHLFTMRFAVPFVVLANGGEQFTMTADDDTFVYVNGQLAVDMGGVHDPTTGIIAIDGEGRVMAKVEDNDWVDTGVKLNRDETATINVFHADRDAANSLIRLEFSGMNLMLQDGVQIASAEVANSPDGYAAPLGVSRVFDKDTTWGIVIAATIEGVLALVAVVLVMVAARYLVKVKVQREIEDL